MYIHWSAGVARAAFRGILAGLLIASQAAVAGGVRPHALRWDRALVTPDAAPHFSCETAAFNDPNGVCYGPDAIRKAYDIDKLIAAGYTGAGQTIVIIEAYGSPTLAGDLAAFDARFGLPPPPSLQQIHMPGSTPFDYADDNQVGWAEETSLDVQWAHAVAPGARIVVVAAATNNDDDILAAQNYAIDHKLGFIMSESFGESELALLQEGPAGIKNLNDNEKSYKRAADGNISVVVSSGDDGAAGTDINDVFQTFPVADYPASSPNVTTIGGTSLYFGSRKRADPKGTYQGEVVWNETFPDGSDLASGGGISGYFAAPDYQNGLAPKSGPKGRLKSRAYPDVAYNAGVYTGVLVYLGFLDTAWGPGYNGFYAFGGTSVGTPQWAGIVAIANQKGGKPLGFLNKTLYDLGKKGTLGSVLNDITLGDNGAYGVPGYPATPGWDFATGWGTPNAGLVDALIKGSK